MPIWIRSLLITVGIVAFANTLHAEPIPWNYNTALVIYGSSAWTSALPNQVLSGGTANTTTTGELWGNSPGWTPEGGSRTITVGEAHPGVELSPDNPLLTRGGFATSFGYIFNLQDAKSGESTTLSFIGGVRESVTTPDEPPFLLLTRSETIFLRDPATASPWLASTTLRLGANDYTVDLTEREDGFGTAYIDAEVRVNAANTPEPSTFILGGIGLAGLTLGRRRRRRATTG